MIFLFFSTRNANKDKEKTRFAESLFWRQLLRMEENAIRATATASRPPSDSSGGRAAGAAEGEGGRALMCESEKI